MRGSLQGLGGEDKIEMEREILKVLGLIEISARECEKKLILLGLKDAVLIKTLVKSRHVIFYGTLLKKAPSQEQR